MSGENLRSSHMQHSGAAQPAPGLCQLVHVVPDTLCDGLTFQLTEHRCDVHHRAAHGAGRVKTFPDGHKVDAKPSKLFNQAGKIADVAADAEFGELEFPPDGLLPPAGGVYRLFYNGV